MSGFNAYVKLRQNESIDSALKRFNSEVGKSGILQQLKDKECYLKPSAAKRLKRIRRKLLGL